MTKGFAPALVMLSVSFLVLFMPSSCRHDTDQAELLPDICFEKDILPIFQTSCAISGCHNSSAEGGYNLSDYEGIMKGITPGEPLKSEIYTSLINIWSAEEMMPPDRPLSPEYRSLIKVWIEQGANAGCP